MSQPLSTGAGRPITLAASPGAAIHQSVAGKVDEVTLVVSNTDGSAHILSFDIGGSKAMEASIAAHAIVEYTFLVTNGDDLTAFGDVGDVLVVTGLVTRTG